MHVLTHLVLRLNSCHCKAKTSMDSTKIYQEGHSEFNGTVSKNDESYQIYECRSFGKCIYNAMCEFSAMKPGYRDVRVLWGLKNLTYNQKPKVNHEF